MEVNNMEDSKDLLTMQWIFLWEKNWLYISIILRQLIDYFLFWNKNAFINTIVFTKVVCSDMTSK